MVKMVTLLLAAALLAAGCSGNNGAGNAGNQAPANAPAGANAGPVTPSGADSRGGTPAVKSPTNDPAVQEPAADNAGGTNGGGSGGETEQPPSAATAAEAADKVLHALQTRDLDALNRYIHPKKGVLFSPYAHIDKDTAVIFQAGGLPAKEDATEFTWGSYDGSGEPIKLTFDAYLDKFVTDKDYTKASRVGKNEVLGRSSISVNIAETFPGASFFDYYMEGTDKDAEGMDWSSLILVMEQLDGAWYVSGIVHNQWTI